MQNLQKNKKLIKGKGIIHYLAVRAFIAWSNFIGITIASPVALPQAKVAFE